MTKKYYNTTTFNRVDIEDSTMELWISVNNPKAEIYQLVPEQPPHDPETQRVEWGSTGWVIIDLTAEEITAKTRKVWPTKAEFWNEFTSAEQIAIMDSTIPDIRLLDRQLLVWPGEVWSDDVRVQAGLDGLVGVGILTPERKTEILSK
jgi:hypothetical protein